MTEAERVARRRRPATSRALEPDRHRADLAKSRAGNKRRCWEALSVSIVWIMAAVAVALVRGVFGAA